ncbi:HtaA domain-containing protein [Streptomyces lanatus]|uniref:HtaA domain-containing protein n=1 Tax=Streptomyces lanatus TaxID=66900 RepID=A0ABV1XQ22_9ACTN|nr:HtaA domain-containing protein [Streptomyces lanatus]GHG87456.1 hypothetical protein GCM10018780_05000 [Streptomyces lanatus]
MKTTKRPGAAAVTGGTLLAALLCPGAAQAVDEQPFPRTISDGYLNWTTTDPGLSIDVTEPAVRKSTDRTWFPATDGSADPETGAMDVGLGGATRFTASTSSIPPLTLGGLRLRLNEGDATLHARTVTDRRARELALAEVTTNGTEPVVRPTGVTWTGLRASLTDDGARLLSQWSGESFAEGDDLGLLDVTVATEGVPATEPPAIETPSPAPVAPKQPQKPAATVTAADLTPGTEQTVTGSGFTPGEIVLVAIDQDTRYQAQADDTGRISQKFPVYDSAAEGAHTVELYTVTGERKAVAEFDVRADAP